MKTTVKRALLAALILNLVVAVNLGAYYGIGYLFSAHNGMPTSSAQMSVPDSVSLQRARETQSAFNAAAESVSPAVVSITTSATVTQQTQNPFEQFQNDPFFRRFFGDQFFGGPQEREYKRQGLGSGLIVSADGLIITNNHVISGADEIIVRLKDDREFKAELVGSDPHTDIALIRVIEKGQRFPTAELGNSDDLVPGQWAIAIGTPFGLTQTVTVGVVSAVGRGGLNLNDYEDFIQTDCSINPGNSGGPLIDIDGRVIGINAAIRSNTGQFGGIGFAIPINMVKKVKDDLLELGKVSRGYLGVQIQAVDAEIQKQYDLPDEHGLIVKRVFPGTPAADANLRVNDVILSIGGSPVNDANTLRNIVANTREGERIDLRVRREGREFSVPVTIAQLPEEGFASLEGGEYPEIGLTLKELDQATAAEHNLRPGMGLLVTKIDPKSKLARTPVKEGAVILELNNKPVATFAEFEEAMRAGKNGTTTLRVYQDGVTMDVTIR